VRFNVLQDGKVIVKLIRFNKGLVFIFLIFSGITLYAGEQAEVIHFKEGLVLKRPNARNNESRNTDPVEVSIVNGTWKAPVAGDQVIFGDTTLAWESIKADDDGWFSDRSVRGAYLYIPVHSEADRIMLLDAFGNDLVYINGELRVGNRYGTKDVWESWEPNFNFTVLPVQLKRGNNEFLFFVTRAGRLKATMRPADTPVTFNLKDPTLPDFITGEVVDTWGAVVLVNGSRDNLDAYVIEAQIDGYNPVRTMVPVIPPLSVRKTGFRLVAPAFNRPAEVTVNLKLFNSANALVSQTAIQMKIKKSSETHKRTFISNIDGSVQYYAVNPAQGNPEDTKALVLSVHGAAVEAINQANSYNSKTWANIVAPTNRRPYGFNWEDWGRLDALEVLDIAKKTLKVNPDRVYLTGHSMGGHGSWHLGVTYPDHFAAIGPSAGWISFWSYRMRGNDESPSPMQEILRRSTSPSHTTAMAENYKQHGVYIIHGSADDNVRVDQARQMVEVLTKFHKDIIYHEEPGQGHWWDISDETGSDCVDWAPLFDFFARHARPQSERIRHIEFITASPGISATNNWLAIEMQQKQLQFSKADIRFDPGKCRFVGQTENVSRLAFDAGLFADKDTVTFHLDSLKSLKVRLTDSPEKIWLSKENGQWICIQEPSKNVKGPHRYGTFKDAFKNRFVFVYGTKGTAEENAWAFSKARFDAEYFWYQGNGSIDVLADSEFDALKEVNRNVILYGNAETNGAWKSLLGDSPVQVLRGKIKIGKKTLSGKDLGCLMIRPRPGSGFASVGIISGTGITGMRSTNRRPYLSPGISYPDVTIFTPQIISDPDKGVKMAGFFGPDWKLDSGEIVWDSSVK